MINSEQCDDKQRQSKIRRVRELAIARLSGRGEVEFDQLEGRVGLEVDRVGSVLVSLLR